MTLATPGAGTWRVGTRSSRLARVQSALIALALERASGTGSVEVLFSTGGDLDTVTPLPSLGGRGVFTDVLERELLAGTIDYAVHSLKDVPVDPTPGLVLAAVGFREDPRDVLVSGPRWTLATLPAGARVGTCSVRRSAQLLAARPDLRILPLRGNVDTRLGKLAGADYDAIVLAAAGIARLGLLDDRATPLAPAVVLPAPGQGTLAVQCREDDLGMRGCLAPLDDPTVRATTAAERAFLEGLGGGCLAPIAALGAVKDGRLSLCGTVLTPDGRERIDVTAEGDLSQGRETGLRLAEAAITRGALRLLA